MITQENQPKRGAKCYWKFGDDGYGTAYFISLTTMPIAPHAVKVEHHGQEWTLKDYEVFTELDKFKDKHRDILNFFIEFDDATKVECSRRLSVPYSRVLNVYKTALEKGIIHAKET